jgi:seryl-tRNA synthetase
MIVKIKRSFDEGLEKIRWLASLLSERIKVEVAVVKLLIQADGLERKRDELVRSIGERVFELRERKELDALRDPKIRQALAQMEEVDSELKELKDSVSRIGTPE